MSGDKGTISGATIKIEQGGRAINTITTDGSGKYAFELPLGGDYMVTVSMDGYVSKKFSINTQGVPPEKATTKFPIIQASLGLFKKMEGIDYSALNQPLNKYKYSPEVDNFEYDDTYLEQMLAKVETIKAAEKDLLKKEKEKDASYASTIKLGDKQLGNKDLVGALASYQEAQRLKPGEAYPATQIAAVNKLMADNAAKKAADEAAAKAKADKEAADKKAAEEAAAKQAADAAAAKAKADADALAKKQADEAAAKAKADAEALAKKQAEEAAAKKAAEETAAKAKADKEAADKKAAEDAAAKAKADKEAADKLAKEKADAEAKAKADKAAADKKAAEEAAAKAKADAEALAKKQAEDAAAKKASDEAAAKAKADKDAADKKAAEEAAAKAKADKEAADKLAKEKAEADAKAKAEKDAADKKAAEEAAAKAKADKAAADKKAAEDAAAKQAADAAATKARADKDAADKLAKEKADAEAKAKAEKDAADKKAADAADAKAKADKDAADKKAAADAAAKAKSDADALAKKQADEAAAKARADKDAADKLAKEKSDADAKAKAEKDAADKIAAGEAAAKAKAEKDAADKLAREKAADEAKARAEEDNKKAQEQDSKYKSVITRADDAFAKNDWISAKLLYGEAIGMRPSESYPKNRLGEVEAMMKNNVVKQDEIKGKSNGSVLPVLGSDVKYKEAVKRGDELFGTKRYKEAKKSYEEALTYKGGDSYARNKLIECEKMLNADDAQKTDERVKQLLAKYGPGVTEETIPGSNVVILQRVVVKDNMAWVFQKKMFNWGGVAFFRDNLAITESTFEQETKP